MFGGLFLLLLVAPLPIAYCLGIMGLIGTYVWWGGWGGVTGMAATAFSQTANFIFGPIPMFILMGDIIVVTGISARAFRALDKLAGRVRGSLAYATTVLTTIFGAVTGFSPASCAAIGSVAIPEMLKRKYDPKLAVGVVGGGAALAILIPPSILMVQYGGLAEVSIGRLFMAGVVPGLVSSALFMAWIFFRSIVAPAGLPRGAEAVPWKDKLAGLVQLLPLAIIIFMVLGTLYMGMATPSEVAAMGCIAALAMAVGYRVLNWTTIRNVLLSTVCINAMVFAIIFGAQIFTQVLVYVQIPVTLSQLIISLPVSRWVIMWAMQALLIIMGCFMAPVAILAITVPIFAPVVKVMGFDLMVFGVILMINMELATLTPPVGLNLFVLMATVPKDSGITIIDIVKGVTPFVVLHGITMVIVAYVPQLALWLPSMMR
jgi:tripartite ATP-independent transporter DctM subunit